MTCKILRGSTIYKIIVFFLFWGAFPVILFAQRIVEIGPKVEEHIFTGEEISIFEDRSGKMSFEEIREADAHKRFRINKRYYPQNPSYSSFYWYKVRIRYPKNFDSGKSIIEFYDQTADQLTSYLSSGSGKYIQSKAGSRQLFNKRLFFHKNFQFIIPNESSGLQTYYLQIQSANQINVIIVYRTISRFINYALLEYIIFGLFYGMMLGFTPCVKIDVYNIFEWLWNSNSPNNAPFFY